MLFYPSVITLSNRTLDYVARLIRRHRTSIGSRWRRLPGNRQALLVLAHLRNGDAYQRLATGFGVGLATAYRYIRETVDLLAAGAPSLTQAVTGLAGSFSNYALLDGTVIRIDRCGDRDRLKACYSVKVRHRLDTERFGFYVDGSAGRLCPARISTARGGCAEVGHADSAERWRPARLATRRGRRASSTPGCNAGIRAQRGSQ